MSTTLLPFLYQTRTLQRMSRGGLSTPGFRALLHSTTRANSPRERPRPIKPTNAGPDDIPFQLPEGYERPDKRTDAERDAESGVKSTITPSEREAFTRIFEEIAARPKAGAPAESAATSPEDGGGDIPSKTKEPEDASFLPGLRGFKMPVENFPVRTEEPNPELIRNTINIIVQDAAEIQTSSRRQTKKPFDPLHPLEQISSATEWEKAFLRFPPSLRQAARMALGTVEEGKAAERLGNANAAPEDGTSEEKRTDAQMDLALDPLSKDVQNEALRREERTRVDAKMRAAKNDFELWDVLEDEVFPLVRKFGLDEVASKTESSSKRGGKRKKSELPLHIYGPLYPAYLLNALGLFDTHFARSSPLALHILPRVKELGPASYVLGVSTPFYNELARVLWNRYGDPTAVFNLLEEMRVVGLYCDEGTRQVVLQIEQFLASVGQGHWGPFLRELVSLPEYEFAVLPRIRHWMTTINHHIVERRNSLQE
ncbi:hypothetical protein CHGG_00331 [Chaetomium globosum CBS 148.51]|uniref:Mtf2-like C-terminal domain-containing protein n=1 Tax=Chaetomium globosum (strain ATCC 6205 / CBS 148.51 / DSM 1962 / NBRC 6347 / NRRL 1970) TaxID=306901 RepID=Q2HHH3_CHAGB|nr:uncharacterized protein CHGG_00331 [Chaetomium globosum CBS 148.51]EAQ92096.1 hypothetical protein CHGG_00331 [Chaetomium globosum CBS 148.51]